MVCPGNAIEKRPRMPLMDGRYHQSLPRSWVTASVPSNILVPERLVRCLLLLAHVPHHDPVLLPRVPPRLMRIRLLIARLRARHALVIRIVVPSPLSIAIPFDAITAPRAAAAREQPEEARRPAKCHRHPCPDIDGASHGAVDVVVLERGVEGAGERGI